MKRLATIVTTAFLSASALAQTPPPAPGAMPPPPPRARGPQLALAVEMAQAAIAQCATQTYKVTALVTDRVGIPVALLSSDGVGARTQQIAPMKVMNLVNHFAPGSNPPMPAGVDPALAERFKWDPAKGVPRQGGLPIMVGNEFIGAIAVSGAPGGDKDEACAQVALDKVKARLK